MDDWFESFYGGLYEEILPSRFDEEETLHHARIVKRLLGVVEGQSVLDVPCGMGRITAPLAGMGLRMTGVDFHRGYLKAARLRARKENLEIRFIHGDMRRIAFEREFDGAFNWFGSFGYFSDGENLDFLKRVFRAVRPGGRFLVEGVNKSWYLTHLSEELEKNIGDVVVKMKKSFDAETSRDRSLWTFERSGRVERHRLGIKIFDGAELRAVLEEGGFRDVELRGWPSLEEPADDSPRLIAVASRPGGQGGRGGRREA